jgi:hypothetical protein
VEVVVDHVGPSFAWIVVLAFDLKTAVLNDENTFPNTFGDFQRWQTWSSVITILSPSSSEWLMSSFPTQSIEADLTNRYWKV